MSDSNVSSPAGDPPAALNTLVKFLLKTPILQTTIGKHLALLSFTGRRSGKRYTIPVSCQRKGDSVFMLTEKSRSWWQNFEDEPAVELRIAGKVVLGTARAHVATDADLDEVVGYLANRPQDAKAYGATVLPDGSLDPDSVRRLLPRNVLLHVDLA